MKNMKNMKFMLLIAVTLILSITVILSISAISGVKPDIENIVLKESIKTTSQDLVDIAVEFSPATGEYWEFNVYLDTHSVDLTGLDLTEYITFNGNVVVDNTNGLSFTSTGEGHHIQNKLLVPKFVDNVATLDNTNQEFSLVILPIDGSESSELVWELDSVGN